LSDLQLISLFYQGECWKVGCHNGQAFCFVWSWNSENCSWSRFYWSGR
jgi:hypothetical protein